MSVHFGRRRGCGRRRTREIGDASNQVQDGTERAFAGRTGSVGSDSFLLLGFVQLATDNDLTYAKFWSSCTVIRKLGTRYYTFE